MKLHYSPGASSLMTHIVACETDITLQLDKFDFATHKTEAGADFYAINPKGYIPALVLDSGEVLTESLATAVYLAEQKPSCALLPESGTLARARVFEWTHFIGTEIHKPVGQMFNPQFDEAAKTVLRASIDARLKFVDAQMQGRQFLVGDACTLADMYLFMVACWPGYVGLKLEDYPNILALHGRVAQRPAVQQAMKEEGLG